MFFVKKNLTDGTIKIVAGVVVGGLYNQRCLIFAKGLET